MSNTQNIREGNRDKIEVQKGNRIAPIRIQRKRTKGWKMPENTVYVGRPTKWGNPYPVNDHFTFTQAVFHYKQFVEKWGIDDLEELRGKNLACFCPLDQPCHADVLLELANTTTQNQNQ